jgi:hypothetical protein
MQGNLEKHLSDIVTVLKRLAKRIRKLETVPPGANKFTELSDAPSTYVGSTGLFVAVNAGETALEFVAGGGGGVHEILSATHSDSDPDSVVQGDIIVGDGTPEWSRLPIGGVGDVLTSDGTDASWQPGGGGGPHDILSITHSDSNPDAVVQGDLVIGNATPNWDRLPIGGVGEVLTSDGTDPSWQVPAPGAVHDILSATHGDATIDGVIRGDVIVGNDTPDWTRLPIGGVGDVLTSDGVDVSWQPGGAGGPHDILSATHSDAAVDAVTEGSLIMGNATPAWDELVISVPGANVRNLLGVDIAETQPSWKPLLDGTNPTTIAPSDAAAPGTSLIASHRDHQHASPATFPPTAHNVLSASHGDAIAHAITRGDLLVGNSTPKIDGLPIGTLGTVLYSDGVDPSWQPFVVPSSGVGAASKVYACKSFI